MSESELSTQEQQKLNFKQQSHETNQFFCNIIKELKLSTKINIYTDFDTYKYIIRHLK